MQKIQFINDANRFVFDAILKHKPNLNYQILNTLLRKKDIRLNNEKLTKNQLAKNGDTITLFLPEKEQKRPDIVYQDDNLLIVFKPQGMETTVADKTYLQSDSLEDIFADCFACHRLDKNTEGLVVLAKNKTARNIMFDCFKNHKIQKFYKAIATGNVKQSGEELNDYHKKQNDKVFIFSTPQPNSSKIITTYNLEKQNNDLYLLDINIKTGKTHQIRAQLAHHGIFILGDERYGKKEINKLYKTKKQLLCAYKIKFADMPKMFEYLNNKTIIANPTFLTKYDF